MIVIPEPTLRALAVEAQKRGMTAIELIGKAVTEYLVNHPVEDSNGVSG